MTAIIRKVRRNLVDNERMLGSTTAGLTIDNLANLPTGYEFTGGNVGTVAAAIAGQGTDNGVPYVDISLSGTSGTGGSMTVFSRAFRGVNGDILRLRHFMALTAGALTNISTRRVVLHSFTRAFGSYTAQNGSGITPTGTLQRFEQQLTLANASAEVARFGFEFAFSNSAAISATFRLGLWVGNRLN